MLVISLCLVFFVCCSVEVGGLYWVLRCIGVFLCSGSPLLEFLHDFVEQRGIYLLLQVMDTSEELSEEVCGVASLSFLCCALFLISFPFLSRLRWNASAHSATRGRRCASSLL